MVIILLMLCTHILHITLRHSVKQMKPSASLCLIQINHYNNFKVHIILLGEEQTPFYMFKTVHLKSYLNKKVLCTTVIHTREAK